MLPRVRIVLLALPGFIGGLCMLRGLPVRMRAACILLGTCAAAAGLLKPTQAQRLAWHDPSYARNFPQASDRFIRTLCPVLAAGGGPAASTHDPRGMLGAQCSRPNNRLSKQASLAAAGTQHAEPSAAAPQTMLCLLLPPQQRLLLLWVP